MSGAIAGCVDADSTCQELVRAPAGRLAIVADGNSPDPDDIGATALGDKPSIAVLPFTNMSGDTEQEYFADGISEDIANLLCRNRWLRVVSRNSAFAFSWQVFPLALGLRLSCVR